MHVVTDQTDPGRGHHRIEDVVHHLAIRGTWNSRNSESGLIPIGPYRSERRSRFSENNMTCCVMTHDS